MPILRSTSFEFGYLSPIPPEGESWDEWVIERGIAAALRERRSIDDRTARYIAAQLHDGQASALYSLTSTGAIDELRIDDELGHGVRDLPQQVQRRARWLIGYCSLRPGAGPVAGWNRQIAEQDRAELVLVRRNQAIAELDNLFAEQPDEAIGDVQEPGWFGLVRRAGRPGGLVLMQDQQGFRHIRETDSDQELTECWAGLVREHDRSIPHRPHRRARWLVREPMHNPIPNGPHGRQQI